MTKILLVLLLCGFCQSVLGQDTTTINANKRGGGITKISFSFISDGKIDTVWAYRVAGEIGKVVIIPGATTPFEETMDLTLTDVDSTVLITTSNVDSNASTVFTPVTATALQDLFLSDSLRLIIDSTGTQTKGRVEVYIR
jgi:hypothetical protein